MVWFRENWCEEVLRQLRLGLAKCYTLAFENRGAVNDAIISVSTHNFLKKLVSTFGIGLGKKYFLLKKVLKMFFSKRCIKRS